MKITAMTVIAVLTGAAASATENAGLPAEHRVTVCMEGRAPVEVAIRARWMASKMFAGIGVTIDWRTRLEGCPSQGILISLSGSTPASLQPHALAYALPYEGTHIRVFYDRMVRTYPQSLVPIVLGHVLAHEITHILQGINRHSDRGIMKAHWNGEDLTDMTWKPLEFESLDIELIYNGLAARAQGLLAANKAPRAVAGSQ
jgi:hypothetical protein